MAFVKKLLDQGSWKENDEEREHLDWFAREATKHTYYKYGEGRFKPYNGEIMDNVEIWECKDRVPKGNILLFTEPFRQPPNLSRLGFVSASYRQFVATPARHRQEDTFAFPKGGP